MDKLLPKFITDRIPMFGGGDSDNKSTTNNSSANTNISPPKDLNELVDRIMDNQNIDNKTKREILTVILKNLEHEDVAPHSMTSKHSASNNQLSPVHYMTQPHVPSMMPMQLPFQQPMMPYQQSMMPMQLPFQQSMMQYPGMAQPMYMPYPAVMAAPYGANQIDMLTSKVNDLSGELGQLVALVKGQIGDVDNTPKSKLEHIKQLINGLSSSNQIASNINTSEPSTTTSEEPQVVSDLPSKTSSVNNSLIDSVGSAINSVNSALGLNSSEETPVQAPNTETPQSATPTTPLTPENSQSSEEKISPEAQKILDEESAAVATAENTSAPKPATNMYDLNDYPIEEPKLPEQKTINSTISNNTALASQPSPATNSSQTAANKPATNSSQTAANKPATNSSQTAANKPAVPASNLADAISNLNKSAAVKPVEVITQQPTQQQQPQTGGSKTIKKRSGVLSKVADALGLTNVTQKAKHNMNSNGKRGRPKKN